MKTSKYHYPKFTNPIINNYQVKFSLFIPISYWRTIKKSSGITKKPLQINFFDDFCNVLRKLNKHNFELCYHGFFHGIPGKNDNDEFARFKKSAKNFRKVIVCVVFL